HAVEVADDERDVADALHGRHRTPDAVATANPQLPCGSGFSRDRHQPARCIAWLRMNLFAAEAAPTKMVFSSTGIAARARQEPQQRRLPLPWPARTRRAAVQAAVAPAFEHARVDVALAADVGRV